VSLRRRSDVYARPGAIPWRRWLVLAAVTALLAAFTTRMVSSMREAPPLPVLDTLGGDFRLPSTRGGELSLAELRGELVLLNFGYTSCPEVCPTALARMRALLLDLASLGIDVRPLFVTLDPERDNLDALGRYLGYFHPRLVGLRGSAQQTTAIAQGYRVFHERHALASGLDYGFDHSVHIYLIDRLGRVRATFGSNAPIADMVTTVHRLATTRTREEA
jgi:protein SCO1/2